MSPEFRTCQRNQPSTRNKRNLTAVRGPYTDKSSINTTSWEVMENLLLATSWQTTSVVLKTHHWIPGSQATGLSTLHAEPWRDTEENSHFKKSDLEALTLSVPFYPAVRLLAGLWRKNKHAVTAAVTAAAVSWECMEGVDVYQQPG